MIIIREKLSRVACYMTDTWFEFCYVEQRARVFLFINQVMRLREDIR